MHSEENFLKNRLANWKVQAVVMPAMERVEFFLNLYVVSALLLHERFLKSVDEYFGKIWKKWISINIFI